MRSKNGEDRLSSLPEEIRSHILSLMRTKFAVRTSILSKRWRYTWMLVTNLDFDDIYPDHGLDVVSKVVDRVLELCKTSEINLFRLSFPMFSTQKSRVSKWTDKAVALNLEVHLFQLPLSLFTSKTLTKLKLDRLVNDLDVWECPSPVHLPCLKTLDMVIFANPFVSVFKLISGSPVLESLSLKILFHKDEEDYIFNIPTLERLKLKLQCSSCLNKVVLRVPNLEYLFLCGDLSALYVMEDVSSLVEASLSFSWIRPESDHLWVELLKGLRGVKSLLIKNEFSGLINFYIVSSISLVPNFPNKNYLELKSSWNSSLVLQFLEGSPELKHLYIEQLEGSRWIEPNVVPACMLTNLTSIKLSICKGWKCDMQFLKYMLGNGEVLKTVTVSWGYSEMEEDLRLCLELLKLPRASRCCEIHFHGIFTSCQSTSS